MRLSRISREPSRAALLACFVAPAAIALAVMVGAAAYAQTNNRPCSAQAAAMQPRKPTLAERVERLEERVGELEKIARKGAE